MTFSGILEISNQRIKSYADGKVTFAIASQEFSSKRFDILFLELCGVDVWRCPACQAGRMIPVKVSGRIAGLPPKTC